MLVFYVDPLRLALRRGARAAARGIVRVAHLDEHPAPREIHDPTPTGHRDAGWVRVLHVEGQRLRGRGRLMMRREPASPGGAPACDAWLESFVPAEEPTLAAGDQVLLLVETSNEHYPVTVKTIEAGGSVVSIHWTADELPATLRELGGARG